MNPYDVLGVSPGVDDAAIRIAYLKLVRRFSPERFPTQFNEIRKAYDRLKNEQSRARYYLFDEERGGDSPFEVFLSHCSMAEKRTPMGVEKLKEYLKKCAVL